jgi:D-lactate dehydrogenase
MKIIVFSVHNYEKEYFEKINKGFNHTITYVGAHLNAKTAFIAKNHDCVCAFVNDTLNEEVISILKNIEIKLIALRSAGFNHVDLNAAQKYNIKVTRIPAYSPHAIAEHAVGLLLTLNRKIHKAYNRVHEFNFSLEGLIGFNLNKKTVGIIGTGEIGMIMAQIMSGFGCHVIAFDKFPNRESNIIKYTTLEEVYKKSDIISLHVPLNKETAHMVNKNAFSMMKNEVILVNTSRGKIIDTKALIDALKKNKIKGAALDVYEEEEHYFFSDFSETGIDDDLLARLITFPNVLITAHQAFLTYEAISNIITTTLQNISEFERGTDLKNEVRSSL